VRLKAVSENKDTAATLRFRIMNIAGLATAGKVPFVNRVFGARRAIMRILLQLILVGLIWGEDVCWQLKETAWETG